MFQFKLERDAAKLQTNRRILYFAGGLYDGSWKTALWIILRISFLVISITQFVLKIILDRSESMILTLETVHWVIVIVSLLTMLLNCIAYSSLFLKMEATIKSGFYDYGGNLSEEQIKTRGEANRDVQLTTLGFAFCVIFTQCGLYMKGPLFLKRWRLSYEMWMPFKINSWFSYYTSMGWTWLVNEPAATNACMDWVMYMTMAVHLIGQFRILLIAIRDIDALAAMEGTPEEIEVRLMARIKQCVQHHLVLLNPFGVENVDTSARHGGFSLFLFGSILLFTVLSNETYTYRFFEDFQTYYKIILLWAAFSLGMMLCTLGFILITPEGSLASKSPLLLLLVPELLFAISYCILGQMIVDIAEEVGMAIWETKWYTMPLPVQRDMLMILVGAKKRRQLKAMGLQEYSLKGLSEIFQATFTYFNMIMALSRK